MLAGRVLEQNGEVVQLLMVGLACLMLQLLSEQDIKNILSEKGSGI